MAQPHAPAQSSPSAVQPVLDPLADPAVRAQLEAARAVTHHLLKGIKVIGMYRHNEAKFPEFLQWMLDNKLFGNKVKQGFFKKGPKDEKGKKTFLAIDPTTREYIPQVRKDWPILKELKGIDDPAEKVKSLLTSDTEAGRLAWRCIAPNLTYAVNRLGEVTDGPLNVDRAIKNGFAFELGPFELWDTLGVERVVARMRFEEQPIAPLVEQMLAKGITSFYRWEHGLPIAQLNPKTLAYDAILED